jgi:HK97 family phage major capsid protein
VPENAYLKSLRAQYEAHEKSIAGLEARAVEAKRDLTNEEMRSIVEMGEKNKSLYTQIEDLSEIELRNAKVSAMAARVNDAIAGAKLDDAHDGGQDDGGQDDGTRSVKLGGATTQDRDPGFYTRGSRNSFIGDQYRAAKRGDHAAAERLTKHTNALRDSVHMRDVLGTSPSGGGVGLVPPVWLADQFAPILHRRLRLAAQLQQVPWAGPYPWTIPVANTAATITTVAEGGSITESDPTYTTITVIPATITGYSEVSRQLLEASNPAVDAIIWGDMIGNFYDNAETITIAAVEAQASVNLQTCTGTTIDLNRAVLLDGAAAISDNNAGDADIFVGRTSRWTTYLKFADTTGRPVILAQQNQPQNAIGEGGVTRGFRSPIQGSLENLTVVTSPTVGASRGFIVNSQELLFSISPPMQFQFEQPAGPQLVRVGVWGYTAVVTGRRPKAITKITYNSN